jgi:hypothetical protein
MDCPECGHSWWKHERVCFGPDPRAGCTEPGCACQLADEHDYEVLRQAREYAARLLPPPQPVAQDESEVR